MTTSSSLAARTFESAEHDEQQEVVPCPLCESTQAEVVLSARDLLFHHPGRYPLVRCTRCAMEFVNPRPTAQSLAVHYPNDYFGYSLHEDAPSWFQPFLKATARALSLRRLRYLEKVTGRIQPDMALLDVGCGVNRLLECIRDKRGCTGTGLDFKPEIVSYVRERLDMPIVEGSLDGKNSTVFQDGQFDVVFMMEYLEHELDPKGVLQEARRITRTGGHLALELPYIEAWPGRLFGRYWWNLDIPRHLMFFTRKTLAKMLDQTGFTLVSVKPFTLPMYSGMSLAQVVGLRHWRRYQRLYPLVGGLLALPLMPFEIVMPEFMFCVARAK